MTNPQRVCCFWISSQTSTQPTALHPSLSSSSRFMKITSLSLWSKKGVAYLWLLGGTFSPKESNKTYSNGGCASMLSRLQSSRIDLARILAIQLCLWQLANPWSWICKELFPRDLCFFISDVKEIGEKPTRRRLKMIWRLKSFRGEEEFFLEAQRRSLLVFYIPFCAKSKT